MRVNQNPSRLKAFLLGASLIALTLGSVVAATFDRGYNPRNLVFSSSASYVSPSAKKSQGALASMMQMPLVAPLFIASEHFTSTLGLVNAGDIITYADVILRAPDGTKITSQRVAFLPHSQQHVDIGGLLASVVSPATVGSILVMPSADLNGMPIAASLSITYLGSREPNYIDEELSMPSSNSSQTLRAVADPTQSSPLLAVTSLAESVQRVSIFCISGDGAGFSKSVELAPGQMLFTEGCTNRPAPGTDFDPTWEDAPSSQHTATGIALSSDGMPGSFAAFALAPHRSNDDKFFSSVPFVDPKMILSSTTVFAGVPVGTSVPLPVGNYVPKISMANFSQRDAHVMVEYARTSGDSPTSQEVASVVVHAQSSRNIALQDLQGDANLQNSFLIISDGAAGDVVSKLVSTSESGLREVESLGKDENDPLNGGNHPWSIEQGGDSTLLLFNHSSEPQYFSVAISAGPTVWQKIFLLASMQTEGISIRGLVSKQVPDDQRLTMPKDALNGEVVWFTPGSGVAKGRILQSNRDLAMARSFSCGNGYALCNATFVPGTTTLPVGSQGISFGHAVPIVCSVQVGGCTGTTANVRPTGITYFWSSNNTSIISISGANTAPGVSVNGVGAGSTNVSADIEQPTTGCSASAGANGTVYVQVPTSLSIVSGTDSTSTEAPCTTSGGSAGCGVTRTFTYQVNDQNGFPIAVANMPVGDVICNTSTNQLNLQGYNTTCGGTTGACFGTAGPCGKFTDASGQFPETLTLCAPLCKPSGTCTTAGQTIANQTWTVAGQSLTSDVKSISYQCNKILVNGK